MEESIAVASLAALAQPLRLRVFRALVSSGPEGMNPGALGTMLDVPASTLSFHLKELAAASLIRSRQEGRFVIYAAQYEAMNSLVGFLTEKCCQAPAVQTITFKPRRTS